MTIRSPDRLLASYRPLPGAVDELLDDGGVLRSHWTHVGHALDELGLDELVRRRREAARLLDDDGVTYNVYEDGPGSPAPWRLDPLPVLVSSDEWASIERGVIQRSELLNLVLTDLYGPRDLLRRGLLPPELVFAHPGFVRAFDQVRIPGAMQLFNCAFDLAREPGGGCRVLADRTQAPSGAGYALENRLVVSRIFPSLYRDAEVHRLAPFFRALRGSLQAVAPRADSEARIVVLSPGPWSETAFEHAYLASYLGYTLVEGADLTVRDGKVWLRSLGRLERVDVILRRVDAWFCDPLELRPDSQLGVPGLVGAARLGNVTIVNTLGSGVLENPGLLPFLPKLSERLLGQPLRLPSVDTWWCGDDTARQHVLANLASLVLKPTARGGSGPSAVFGAALSSRELDELRCAIEARPHLWVGQEPVVLAAAPTLTDHGLEARRAVLRAFSVARGESYAAMPGGLTRVAPTRGDSLVSNQAGALSKDTWVLASEPETLTGFWLQGGRPTTAVEPAGSMSARAAENLFWLGRYAERAEDIVRLLRAVHDRRTEFEHGLSPAGIECLRALFVALTHVTTTYPGFVGEGADERVDAPGPELRALEVDERRAGTLAHSLRRLLDASHAVRDQLSGDTWIVIGSLDRSIPRRDSFVVDRRRGSQNSLSNVMTSLLALAGLGAESMVRDPGWYFMDAGRRIERAIQLASLLRATVTVERDTATDSLLLESVLTAAESIITYRRRYRSHAQLETVLDLLALDDDNPRSLAYQLDRLTEDLAALPSTGRRDRLDAAQRLVLEATTTLRLADTAHLAATAEDGTRQTLDAFLARIIELLCKAADAIDVTHFTHLMPQRTLQGG
jgi:uncharacterized circularly permuted ATP-grasp superfamily protein/uncharacterized alpha-E superfamily protein